MKNAARNVIYRLRLFSLAFHVNLKDTRARFHYLFSSNIIPNAIDALRSAILSFLLNERSNDSIDWPIDLISISAPRHRKRCIPVRAFAQHVAYCLLNDRAL